MNVGGFMSKVSNVITMLELLQNGKKYSINELSKELEVSERMIRVYKEDLEKAGIYVDTIMGPYGGYVLNQQIRMPIRKFKLKDAKLLDKYILKEKDKKIKEELIILQDKIKGVYIGSKQEEKELNLKEETGKKYNLLTRAIKEKRKVKLLIIATDASERTKNKFVQLAEKYGIPVITYAVIESLSKAIGKSNKAILGIKDNNFAQSIQKKYNGGDIIG